MAPNVVSIAFIHIGLAEGGAGTEDLKVHTGLGSAYPVTSPWSDYIGAGGLLSLGSVHGTSETSATEYEMRLNLPEELGPAGSELSGLFEDVRRRDLQATPVCIHAVDIPASRQANPPDPTLLLAGRINQLDLSRAGITARIYTPATLLNKVVGAVVRLNDFEHKRHIDSSDGALRFIGEVGSNVYFP